MDSRNPLWSATSLMVTGLLPAVLLVEGCRRSAPAPDSVDLPTGEIILALAPPVPLMLEVTEQGLSIRIPAGEVECSLSPEALERWQAVKRLTARAEPYRERDLTVDPNREYAGVVIGHVSALKDGDYEVRHVGSEADALVAAEAINAILAECGLEERVHVLRGVQPERP